MSEKLAQGVVASSLSEQRSGFYGSPPRVLGNRYRITVNHREFETPRNGAEGASPPENSASFSPLNPEA